MLADLVDYWCKSTFKEKIALLQQIAIEVVIIIVVGFAFFWCTFLFTWFIALFIGVEPYLQISSPNFHMRNLMPDSLLTIYVNNDMKKNACSMGPDHLFFSELTVPYHEYCNIEQLPLPFMKATVDITILEVDIQKIAYVTSCIKHLGRQVSCQKYPATYQLLLFRNVDFHGLYYLQVELHLKKADSYSLSYTPKIRFEEQCGFLSRFIKDYYTIFMLIFSYGITALLTLAAIVFRLAKIVENFYKNKGSQPTKEQTKQNSQLKQDKVMYVSPKVLQNAHVLPQNQQQGKIQKQKMIREQEPTNQKSNLERSQHDKKQ